jgi:hypothetical protein
MPRRIDDPSDGQPSMSVEEPTAGPIFYCVPHHAEVALAALACAHRHAELALAELANSNSNHQPRPVDEKCDLCDQLGVKIYDRNWCCEDCGQKILDGLVEESERPAPKRYRKTILPGQRGRERKRK